MPLVEAAANGTNEAVRRLLGAGADPNAMDRGDQTPLHAAAAAGHEGIVEILLSAGADPRARDERLCSTSYLQNPETRETAGYTALHLAAEGGLLYFTLFRQNSSDYSDARPRNFVD